jgi:hypothetical protein
MLSSLGRRLRRRRVAVPLAVLLAAAASAAVIAAGRGGHREAVVHAVRAAAKPPPPPPPPLPKAHPQVVRIQGPGTQGPEPSQPPVPKESVGDNAPSPSAPSDAQVRADLKQAHAELASFKRHLDSGAFLQTGPRARVLPNGMAVAPANAPAVIKRVILAGNEIARLPYKWGGGHGAWRDSGYDCSGSVSFALAGAGLLDRPLTSGEFMSWGAGGPGRWITLYASPGHIFMFVAGLRFDTSGQGRAGTRWQEASRSVAGFAVRHPPGY